MQDWTDSAWRAEAEAWIRGRLGERGVPITGPIEQPHVRVWATVMRIPTADGSFWFKANGPTQAYEATAVELIAARRPDDVPALLAVDRERGWMLMADGGTRLRELVEGERDLTPWLAVLPKYAELQLALTPDAAELIARGVPDRRLARLPDLYDELLEAADDVAGEELARLRALSPWVREHCERLGALGIADTIQHDDLHDGQVFVRDGRYLVFDWGDACVSHPFFTMSVTLEGVLSWGLDDIENSVDLAPFRDAYLQPFMALAPREELDAGFASALRLGWVCRSLSYQADREVIGHLDPESYAQAVAVRLRLFAAGI